MDGFIGDADVATVTGASGGGYEIVVRAQRHYAKAFGNRLVSFAVGAGKITALALDREGNIYAAAVGEKRASATTSPAGISAAIISMSANAAASAGRKKPWRRAIWRRGARFAR